MPDKTRVLFLCTGNSARSQMAEAFLRRYGGDRFEAHSAGLDPQGLNPLTIQVMQEKGYDLSLHDIEGHQGVSGQGPFSVPHHRVRRRREELPYGLAGREPSPSLAL